MFCQPIRRTCRQQVRFSGWTALRGNAAHWQSVVVSISTGGGTSGGVLLKEHPEAYANDDGNLLSDGRWTYEWDADGARERGDGAPKARPQGCLSRAPSGRIRQQNRLRRMETASLAYTSGAPRKRIDYAYDERGRRTLKSVYTWNTSTSAFNTTPAAKVGFLYHDWNLLQEVDLSGSTPATLRSYYWGLDLSGTLQGAGGVGGLLAAGLNHTQTTYDSAFYVPDANGNVSDLCWSYGGFAAHYDYDAFGNAFGSGQLAAANPYRFSTKYTETDAAIGGNETGLLYYGYRYYNPSTGRWLGRDPAGLRGGINLYGININDTINRVDYLGLLEVDRDTTAPSAAKVYKYSDPLNTTAGGYTDPIYTVSCAPTSCTGSSVSNTVRCSIKWESTIHINTAATFLTYDQILGHEQRHVASVYIEVANLAKSYKSEPDTFCDCLAAEKAAREYEKKIKTALDEIAKKEVAHSNMLSPIPGKGYDSL